MKLIGVGNMIDIENIKSNFKKFCEENGIEYRWMKIEEYDFRENYFEKNEHVWDELIYDADTNPAAWEENQENLEIDVDGWFKSDYPECPGYFTINGDLFDALDAEGYITEENKKDWINDDTESDEYGELLLENKQFKDLPDKLKIIVNDWWDNIVTVEYIQDNDWIADSLNMSYFRDESYSTSAFIEAMAYWTIYFQPDRVDWEVAWKCGLYPFEYYGTFMLALGGCGMDLSPKLDAYQALTSESISESSQLFRDKGYFEYVVGKEITEEVIRKCKLEKPKIIFESEIKSIEE